MEKYKVEINNSQGIIMGDNNEVKDITFNISGTEYEDLDLQKFKNELLILEAFLKQKKEKKNEEKVLLADIIDVNQVIEEKESKENIMKQIKNSANEVFLNTSVALGTNTITAIISKFLGV
ncbi:hypothetical protein [Priestia aryabhattai]|uniref:hypothetical protein n=1 Tax=Priestia aryabhattai TaxID=412384 RepID=UPI000BFCC6F5|nr:hypothetical protein [Priestia aryabhattai]PHF65840.1 hypothetical protein COI42_23310 [Priestia aryabhattai]